MREKRGACTVELSTQPKSIRLKIICSNESADFLQSKDVSYFIHSSEVLKESATHEDEATCKIQMKLEPIVSPMLADRTINFTIKLDEDLLQSLENQ